MTSETSGAVRMGSRNIVTPLDDCGNLQTVYDGDSNLSTSFTGVKGDALTLTTDPDGAPGALDLIRSFENTLNLPNGPDEIGSVDRAGDWCLSHGLPPVADGSELRRLLEFREALREVLYANNGEGDAAAAWDAVRPYAGSARFSLEVDSRRSLALRPANPKSEGAIAALLAIVYQALLDKTWSRLRACRKASCRFAYYDRTKNGSRSWCSMATCGNQEKAARRRLRERH